MSNPVPSDLEIARTATARPIADIAAELGLTEAEVEPYGRTKAKVELPAIERLEAANPRGRYVVVTAITPTPMGEGKTTAAIGLAQGLNRLGHRAAPTIRQPSLGPVFGIKGGAAGGGYSQVLPMEDFNLHLTGDVHAIGSAHNLASAFLDNHLHHGNQLGIDPRAILWPHVVDISDRALRGAVIGLGGRTGGVPRETEWQITVASELMAILALTTDLADLRARLGRVVLAITASGEPVTAEDLEVAGAMAVLLKDAIKPNLLQTLEGGAAFVHAGPFANIAHGNSSILADRIALATHDIVLTEAGFGADMGAEKFFDIKCRTSGLEPDAAVVVVTLRALNSHEGGLENLAAHLDIVARFGLPSVVCVNRFPNDLDAEVDAVCRAALDAGAAAAVGADFWARGGAGAETLAAAVWEVTSSDRSEFRLLYDDDQSAVAKIETIAGEIYGADGVDLEPRAVKALDLIEGMGFGHLPICMAKTQYSLSHDPALKGRPRGFRLPIRDIQLRAGAGFLTPLAGDIRTMPGLPSLPAGRKIDLDLDGVIHGLF